MLTENTFTAPTHTLNYAEGPAAGPSLILLHGITRRWQDYLPFMPHLTQRWHVYALDLRGHGKSDRTGKNYQLNHYIEDTLAFMASRPTKPAVLMGQSLGGVIALSAAARLLEPVRAVIIEDAPLYETDHSNALVSNLLRSLRRLLLEDSSVHHLSRAIANLTLHIPGQDTPLRLGDLPGRDAAYIRHMARCLSQVDPEVITQSLKRRFLENYKCDQLLPTLSCPVLILQANPNLGGMIRDDEIRRAMRQLADGTNVKFENMGHDMHLGQPAPILRTITNFLESIQ